MHSHEEKEGKVLKGFITNQHSTHQTAVTCSIGMAVLLLRKNNFGASDVVKGVAEALKDLKNYPVETDFPHLTNAKPALESIFRRVEEKVDHWDTIDLMVREGGELVSKKHTFLLNEVLASVWLAIKSDAKFVDCYEGTVEQKTEQARQDRKYRIETFLRVIIDIYVFDLVKERLCHQGIRHNLVLILNKSYAGIDLILSANAKVLELLKQSLNARLDNICKDRTRKKKLLGILISTADQEEKSSIEKNTHSILFELDPNEGIKKWTANFFVSHGVDTRQAPLDDLFKEALPYAISSLDSKDFPEFASVRAILTLSFINNKKYSLIIAALSRMQRWIKDNFDLDKEDHLAVIDGFNKIADFYGKYKKYSDFLSFTLPETEKATVDSVGQGCDDYFAKFNDETPPTPGKELVSQVTAAKEKMEAVLKKHLKEQVENFFWRLNDAFKDSNTSEQKNLYAFMLSSHAKEHILNSNQLLLNKILSVDERNPKEPVCLELYEFNQILLQAMMQDVWEEQFAGALRAALDLLSKMGSDEAPTVGIRYSIDLKNTSYPAWLIEQLKYFLCLYESQLPNARDVQPQRPEFLFLLPSQVRSCQEMHLIAGWLDESEYRKYFFAEKVRFNLILRNEFEQQAVNWLTVTRDRKKTEAEVKSSQGKILNETQKILLCLPIEGRLSFFQEQRVSQDFLDERGVNFLIASTLPNHQAVEFIMHYLNRPPLISSINTVLFIHLRDVVKKMPRNERLFLCKWYVANYPLSFLFISRLVDIVGLDQFIDALCGSDMIVFESDADAKDFLASLNQDQLKRLFEKSGFLNALKRQESDIQIDTLARVRFLYDIIPEWYRKEAFSCLAKRELPSSRENLDSYVNKFLAQTESKEHPSRAEYIKAILFSNPQISTKLTDYVFQIACKELLAVSSATDPLLTLKIQACLLVWESSFSYPSLERELIRLIGGVDSCNTIEEIIKYACEYMVSQCIKRFSESESDGHKFFIDTFYNKFFLDSPLKDEKAMIVNRILSLAETSVTFAETRLYQDLAIYLLEKIHVSDVDLEAISPELLDQMYRKFFNLSQAASQIQQDLMFKKQAYLFVVGKFANKGHVFFLLRSVAESQSNRDVMLVFSNFIGDYSGDALISSVCNEFLSKARKMLGEQFPQKITFSASMSKEGYDMCLQKILSIGLGFPSQDPSSKDYVIWLDEEGSSPRVSVSVSSNQLTLHGLSAEKFEIKGEATSDRAKITAISANQFAVATAGKVTVYSYFKEIGELQERELKERELKEKRESSIQHVRQIVGLRNNTLLILSYDLANDYQLAIYDLTTSAVVRKGSLKADITSGIEISRIDDGSVFYHILPDSDVDDSEYGMINLTTFENYPLDKAKLRVKGVKEVKQLVPYGSVKFLVSDSEEFFLVGFNNARAAVKKQPIKVTPCSATLFPALNEEKTEKSVSPSARPQPDGQYPQR